jgi:transcriptional regulator with XRE-family HTH domain
MKEVLSKNIGKYRIAAGYNKKQAAAKLDLPYTTYVDYENGASPSLDKLYDIAKLYHVTIGMLFGEKGLSYPDIMIIRSDDVMTYLSSEDRLRLQSIIEKISEGRVSDGKDPHPRISIL